MADSPHAPPRGNQDTLYPQSGLPQYFPRLTQAGALTRQPTTIAQRKPAAPLGESPLDCLEDQILLKSGAVPLRLLRVHQVSVDGNLEVSRDPLISLLCYRHALRELTFDQTFCRVGILPVASSTSVLDVHLHLRHDNEV